MSKNYIGKNTKIVSNSMMIANADIQFFRTYTKPSSKNIAHQNSKREFWVKKNAPEMTTTTSDVHLLRNPQKNHKDLSNKNKLKTTFKQHSALSGTHPSNHQSKLSIEKIPLSSITLPPGVSKTLPQYFNYYSPLTNEFTRSMVP